ncbi:hypothetical protein QYM36_015590 [Artemia franciscana]|uniref:Uncharacterized protein n=1 Tax=Artemia franciscana TaxID=6661 RepID=A0AA88HFC7_ARTSF|nr:hypothetical protein QYM36_015590 [Artemia franciscana]
MGMQSLKSRIKKRIKRSDSATKDAQGEWDFEIFNPWANNGRIPSDESDGSPQLQLKHSIVTSKSSLPLSPPAPPVPPRGRPTSWAPAVPPHQSPVIERQPCGLRALVSPRLRKKYDVSQKLNPSTSEPKLKTSLESRKPPALETVEEPYDEDYRKYWKFSPRVSCVERKNVPQSAKFESPRRERTFVCMRQPVVEPCLSPDKLDKTKRSTSSLRLNSFKEPQPLGSTKKKPSKTQLLENMVDDFFGQRRGSRLSLNKISEQQPRKVSPQPATLELPYCVPAWSQSIPETPPPVPPHAPGALELCKKT